MATRVTNALRALMLDRGQDPNNFAAEFDHWKSLGENGEYSSYLFGKDGAYSAPKVNGAPNALRHVHLVPLLNHEALQKWKRAYHRRSRKTSDRALVYVSDPYYGNLLIYILDEPDAHAVAQMSTEKHRDAMRRFAAIADRFIHTGEVIA